MKTFELGRGVKLIPQKHWHQCVLKIDFENQQKPFVTIEIGKNIELLRENLSLNEIQNKKWIELLKKSNCAELIKKFAKNPQATIKKWKAISGQQKIFQGKWITIKEIKVLDYKSNHGNWIDSRDIPGKFKFHLDLETTKIKNCQVKIPVEYISGESGYYSIYHGRFELTLSQLLIWENDMFPTRIKYKWIDSILELELFNKKIRFAKE